MKEHAIPQARRAWCSVAWLALSLMPTLLFGQATTAQLWKERPTGSASSNGMSKSTFGVVGAPAIAHRQSTGAIYAAWPVQTSAMGSSEIYVRKWNGSAWVGLAGSDSGGGISQTPDVDSMMPAIAVRESDGHVFVAWQENDYAVGADIFAAEYDPVANQWQLLGDFGMVSWLALHATEPSILLMPNNGYRPVVAWQQQDYNGGTSFHAIHVRRWTGLDWVEMGEGSAGLYEDPNVGGGSEAGGINADDAVAIGGDYHVASFKPRLIPDSLGNCAVVFINGMMRDGNIEYLHGIHVRRYNGNASLMAYEAWEEIGRSVGGDPLGTDTLEARYLAVAGVATGMQLYVAADLNEAGTNNFHLRCFQWTGSGWSQRGAGSIAAAASPLSGQVPLFTPALALDSAGQLTVAWTQPVGVQAEVYLRRTAAAAGGQVTWQEFGTGSASSGGVSANAGLSGYPALSVFAQGSSDAYWVAWQDEDGTAPQVYIRSTGGTPAPEIAVEEPEGTDLVDDGGRDFGTVLTGTSLSRTFTIRNNGSGNLTGLTISKNGTHAVMFTVTKAPVAPVVPGGSTTFTVKFAPASAGLKTAAIHIANNDADETPFDINLMGTGVQSVFPVVKTLGSQDITSTTATVTGSVNAAGSPRDVFFDYGTTIAYGASVAATPATVDGVITTTVAAALTNLQPHTKYHFRARATGELGAANGTNLSFTTRNTPPTPQNDPFVVLPGAIVQLPVLANDTDPDGDTLSLLSFTALNPATAGKLTKTGNVLLFTASATFNGATFNYTAKDAFGGSALATVVLTKGTCSIDPTAMNVPSAPTAYDVAVTASGAWSALESLSWVSVNPVSGPGDGTVHISLLGNNSKTPRSGAVVIGGQTHQITQDGVHVPVLSVPDPIPQGIVGGDYQLPIPTTNLPATYQVTGMPAGLTINSGTGVISGRPTTAKNYTLTIKASNAAGTSNAITFNIEILPLPPNIIGTFLGYIYPDEFINGNRGSRLDLTITKTGSASGKVITGGTTQSFTGRLAPEPDYSAGIPLIVNLPRAGSTPLTLSLLFQDLDNHFMGTLEDVDANAAIVEGWRHTWTTIKKASAFTTLHTFSVDAGIEPEAPQGFGYGSFTPTTAGAVTIAGRLADNNTFTTSGFLGEFGQALVYQGLYGGKGAFGGVIQIASDGDPVNDTLDGIFAWVKPPNSGGATDRVYRNGFLLTDMVVDGGAYPKLLPGGLVLGLPEGEGNAWAQFSLGGLDNEGAEFDLLITIANPSPTGLTNRVIIDPESNENRVTISTLNTATGAFSGQFTIPGPVAALNRTVPFQGQLVNGLLGQGGYGFFLLPELPEGAETLTTSPKNSGRVVVQ